MSSRFCCLVRARKTRVCENGESCFINEPNGLKMLEYLNNTGYGVGGGSVENGPDMSLLPQRKTVDIDLLLLTIACALLKYLRDFPAVTPKQTNKQTNKQKSVTVFRKLIEEFL